VVENPPFAQQGPGTLDLPIIGSLFAPSVPPQPVQTGLRREALAPSDPVREYSEPSSEPPSLLFLHIITSLSPADGGPPEMLRQLSTNYLAAGDRVEVATVDDPQAPYLQDLPFPVHAFGPKRSSYGFSGKLLRWLLANAGRFDFIIINNVWLFPAVAGWLAASWARVPYAVFTHGALDVFFKQRYPRKHFKKSLYWPLQYQVLRSAAAVLFTSQLERDRALPSFWPNRWKSVVVPYGTNPPEKALHQQQEAFYLLAPQLRGRQFFLFISRIHEKKGCDLLIEAFARLAPAYPDIDLVIAGPDQAGLQARLQAQAERAGIADRIHWPGMLLGPAKAGAFSTAEAFILPSHQENFGIVVAESLAFGLPVLISDQVNIWREIVECGAGLVEADTLEGTTLLLRRWLAMLPEERAAIRSRTEVTFRERFSLRRTAETIHARRKTGAPSAGTSGQL
jgi:glycosyltransferase involved in cell wall biosynthesis